MTILAREELRALVEQSEEPCVSMYMPTHRAGKETQQDPIRLKNLLRDAEERLIARGMRSTEAQQLLEPIQDLVKDTMFWQYQSDGLAIFRSANLFRFYSLPLNFDELLVVTDRFHVKPLLSVFTNDGQFYVLALSQNQVRLLQGTHYSVSEVPLQNVPKNIAEALKYDDPERQTQFYTGMPGANVKGGGAGGGDRPAVFHGTGVLADENKKDLLRYFHRIEKALYDEVLRNEQAPLVLAGVDYLLPIYREANSYNHLLDTGVTGNPDTLRPEELHTQAWAVVEPYFQQSQQAAAEQYHEALAHGRAAHDLKEIVPAAANGRVDQLFVVTGHQQWGTFDPETNAVRLHEEAEPGDVDLLDFAAIHTFLNSGTVYAVTTEQMPDDTLAAAIFRY